ncbi:zf-TFIIB domain-containing protein [Undibacterium baiyunense]|uniref:Zf-TFIIB domain-containing protein n=1 Tax=Undibacterium baiyunense TaxID=2828731 RepID=A0A941DC79_9BURK|nr:zf-TFIIB domain-containing protein [Undibacterium baiyunense]MBR7746019.1 zf-TFIIB domain-containing protein [Undibacterium baiyunense]
MYCALDQSTLNPIPIGNYVVHQCGTCSGTFVPGDFFREVRAKAALEIHKEKSKGIKKSAQQQAKVACPKDESQMISLLFKGVEIDICSKCFGVWLDRGEYDKLIAYLGFPHKSDPLKASGCLGTLSISNPAPTSDISGLGDIVELVADICSLIPDV